MASEFVTDLQKHLYDKNSHMELLINGNEITIIDRFTNKEQCKLKINGDSVQFFDGIMDYHFGEEKPPKYLCEPYLKSPSGKYGLWMWGQCLKDGVSNAIVDLYKDQKVMELICTKETGNPEGNYYWISNNGKDGLFEFWTDIYGKIQKNFYLPENKKIIKLDGIEIDILKGLKILNHGNTLILKYYGFCGDTIDYLFFDCTDFENIKKLEGYDEDFQVNKKIKFKDNNIISIKSFGDDHTNCDRGVYQYKIKKDVYQRDGNKLVRIGKKQYVIESEEIRQKRYLIQCELIKSGVIDRPY